MNSVPSSVFLRKRRFFTVLPLLICPFLIFFFWVLGGGSASAAGNGPTRTAGGLNLALPNAKLKDDSHLTKMDYYRKADQDSAKRHTLAKNDPFYRLPGLVKGVDGLPADGAKAAPSPVSGWASAQSLSARRPVDSDRNEALVYRKLAVLNATLTAKVPAMPPNMAPTASISAVSPDVSRIEHLVQTLHSRDTTEDPDLRQLGGLLDKLAALQQPRQNLAATSSAAKGDSTGLTTNPVLLAPLSIHPAIVPTTDLPDSTRSANSDANGFYPAEEAASPGVSAVAIPAVVDQTVTVINGSTVCLRLQAAIRVKGWLIPAGALVYGAIQLSGDRVPMTIHELQYQQQLFPVSLTVYGLDGLPGMAAPASVTRDVAKQSADASVQSVGLTSFDQSIGAQAATAGIQAAKTLLSRKVRLVTVTLPAGYQVLLKDNAQH